MRRCAGKITHIETARAAVDSDVICLTPPRCGDRNLLRAFGCSRFSGQPPGGFRTAVRRHTRPPSFRLRLRLRLREATGNRRDHLTHQLGYRDLFPLPPLRASTTGPVVMILTIVALLIGLGVLALLALVLIGIHDEERHMSLTSAPRTRIGPVTRHPVRV